MLFCSFIVWQALGSRPPEWQGRNDWSSRRPPKAVGVRVEAAHTCMMMRGVQKQESTTVTEFFDQVEQLSALERERLLQALSE